jgi:hypothetical protein
VILVSVAAATVPTGHTQMQGVVKMKALFFAVTALAIGAGIGTGAISPAYACDDAAATSSKAAQHYAWQFGYGKGGRSEWHWVRVN